VLYLCLTLLFLQTGCVFSSEGGRGIMVGSGEYANSNNFLPSEPTAVEKMLLLRYLWRTENFQ